MKFHKTLLLIQNAHKTKIKLSTSEYGKSLPGKSDILKNYFSFRTFQRTLTTKFCILRNKDSHPVAVEPDSVFQNTEKHLYHNTDAGHNILLIQPRVKSGPNWETKSKSNMKIEEAVSLVHTLPEWKVVDKMVMPVANLDYKLLFGKGNMEKLREITQTNKKISAIFIGIDILSSLQNTTLENFFEMRVFDRYQIILQIFRDHAHTSEAKIQLALAEIPYLRVKLCSYSYTHDPGFFGSHHVGGEGETVMEIRKRILMERELKLKKELEKIRKQRELLRRSESRNAYPIVAVVGYTNCGKTTLIKSLTNDQRLQPEDKLFATLDVTLHAGYLPSNLKVLFIDTVGFISDVPTALIQSFRSTLEEIHLADLVVHVRDVSNPNTEMQKETVLKTLQEMNLPQKLMETIVEVRNKIDLLDEPLDATGSDAVDISATKGNGLPDLLDVIEGKLFENTGHSVTLLRIPNGGSEYNWLLKESAIRDAIADQKDANFLIVEVVMSPSSLAKFQHTFGDLSVSVESLSY